MEKNSEKVRNLYVNFEGQKSLSVKTFGVTPETERLKQQIRKYGKE